jgi:hypothetical protein
VQGTREATRAKSRAAYQDFLALWKEAGHDIPILKQAKAEHAKLQSRTNFELGILNCGDSPDSKTLGVFLEHTESDVVLLHDTSDSAR